MHSIYRIINVRNGQCYVGQSMNALRRKQEHFNALRRGDHPNIILQRAYNKYGRHSFMFEVLELNISTDEINQAEIRWIAHFNSCETGYNLTHGGYDVGCNVTRPCIWNGVTYPSVKDAAQAIGISGATMSVRVRKGWQCDEDMPSFHSNNRGRSKFISADFMPRNVV